MSVFLVEVNVLVAGDSLVEGGDEGEGLERGPWLPVALGRQVERALVEVRSADHRPDAARLVVERHQRHARPDAGEAGDRLLGGLLVGEVERGADPQASAEGGSGAVAVDELLLYPGGEIRDLADLVRWPDLRFTRQRLLAELVEVALADVVLLLHPKQHEVAALERGSRVTDRAVGGGGRDQAGEQGRLRRVEHRGAVRLAVGMDRAEVHARG